MNTEIDRKIAVILVADVVGYSKHMERDENATLKAYTECEKLRSYKSSNIYRQNFKLINGKNNNLM